MRGSVAQMRQSLDDREDIGVRFASHVGCLIVIPELADFCQYGGILEEIEGGGDGPFFEEHVEARADLQGRVVQLGVFPAELLREFPPIQRVVSLQIGHALNVPFGAG